MYNINAKSAHNQTKKFEIIKSRKRIKKMRRYDSEAHAHYGKKGREKKRSTVQMRYKGAHTYDRKRETKQLFHSYFSIR